MPINWRWREAWDSIDEYRRWFGRGHLRRAVVPLEEPGRIAERLRPIWAVGPADEDTLCARLDAETALGCLPMRLRRPLVLRAQGYSSKEIAATCGYRNANTADTVIGQARRRMRELAK